MRSVFNAIFTISWATLLATNVNGQSGDIPYSASLEHLIEPDKAEILRKSALNGDGEAARELADFYYLSENLNEDGFFWLRLSAENGNCDSQVRLAQVYRHRNDLSDGGIRAQEWMEIARKNSSCEVRK